MSQVISCWFLYVIFDNIHAKTNQNNIQVTRSSKKRNRKGKVSNEKPNNLLDLNIIVVDDNSDEEVVID